MVLGLILGMTIIPNGPSGSSVRAEVVDGGQTWASITGISVFDDNNNIVLNWKIDDLTAGTDYELASGIVVDKIRVYMNCNTLNLANPSNPVACANVHIKLFENGVEKRSNTDTDGTLSIKIGNSAFMYYEYSDINYVTQDLKTYEITASLWLLVP
jgi:hypothetical protein